MNYVNERSSARRKWINRIMLILSGTAAAIAILILALILGYAMIKGISYLNLTLLTQAAKPVSETGGGMRNEIFGTLILVALGSIIALPIGLMAGVYLAEYANPKVAAVPTTP